MAELVDQSCANRAPGKDEKEAGIHGRIMVTSLASELELKDLNSQLSPEQIQILSEIQSASNLDDKTILKTAFHVRFFYW